MAESNFQQFVQRAQHARAARDHVAALAAFEAAAAANPGHIGVKIDLAEQLRIMNRLEDAEAIYRGVLAIEPERLQALIAAGQICRQRGDRTAALAAFEAALKIDPKNSGVKAEIGFLLRLLGRLDDAEQMFRGILDEAPNHDWALVGLAQLQRHRGEHISALATLLAAVAANPHHANAKSECAYLLRDLGRAEEAEAMFRRFLHDQPQNLQAWIAIGQICRQRGDQQPALIAFETAAKLDPQNAGIKSEIAYLLRHMGRLDEAEAMFCSALDVAPGSIEAMIGLGQLQKARGDRTAALATFEKATVANPRNIGLKIEFAYLLRDLGRLEEAESAFRTVLEHEPNHAGALIGLGYLFVDLYRLNEAQALFANALDVDPTNVGSRIALGHLARRRGDRTSSLLSFEAALGVDPTNIDAKLERAAEFRDRGQFDEAERIIDGVIGSNPEHVQAWLQLGQLHRRRGDRQAALRAFETARENQPKHVQALLELATETRALGHPHKAEDLVKQALDHDASHLGALIQHADHAATAENYEDALAIARRGIELHPRKVWPYLQAARASTELGNDEVATELLSKATAMCGPQPEIVATRIQLFRETRDFAAAQRVLENISDQVNGNFFLWSQKVMLAISTGDYGSAEQALQHAPATSTKDQGRVFLFRAQLAEAQRRYEDAIAAYRESVRLDPTDSWSHGEMARTSMILLNLDEARKHLRTSVELNASANILRGQSLNVSQHHLGQILDEFLLDQDLVRQLREVRTLPLAEQITAFQELVRDYPDSTAPALLLVIAMRQAGLFSHDPAEPRSLAPIPKRIIQFWDSADPPHDISKLMGSWRDLHPNFEYALFDDQSAKEFIQTNFQRAVLRAFGRAQHPAQRADIFRLAYLSANGGFYADADDRSLAFIETFVPSDASLMVYQENYGTLGNNFMGASPNHPVTTRALALATDAINRGDNDILWLSTGPGLLTRAFAQIVSGVGTSINWRAGTVVRELGEMQRVIGFHCPVHYKRTEKHWSRAATRKK